MAVPLARAFDGIFALEGASPFPPSEKFSAIRKKFIHQLPEGGLKTAPLLGFPVDPGWHASGFHRLPNEGLDPMGGA